MFRSSLTVLNMTCDRLAMEEPGVPVMRMAGILRWYAISICLYRSAVSPDCEEPKEIKKKVFLGAMSSLSKNADIAGNECMDAQKLLSAANRIIILGHGASASICLVGQLLLPLGQLRVQFADLGKRGIMVIVYMHM